ncbi:otolin-1-like [Engraulis encrasicolus]|uniref:otolin-1-like n=1 Tax=Engraulis encrasicolus TaxID=184585 RepID=UPI002FD570BA
MPDDYPMDSSGDSMPPEGWPWDGQAKQSGGYPVGPTPPVDPMPPMPPMPPGWNATEGGRSFHDNYTEGPMVHDLSYCAMLMDSPVPATMSEVPWFCMCTLCHGNNRGPKGDRGARGYPGLPGSPGRRGLTGMRGRPGFWGRQGIKGQKGDDGEKGQMGYMGGMGPKGSRGYKGDKGDQGIEGVQGVQGPIGDPGICPASCEPIPGPPGDPGLPGRVGARGIPGVEGEQGPKGQKGDMGDMGMKGDTGNEGAKGDQGAKGECTCTDGEDGMDGMPGPTGPKGDKGSMGVDGLPGTDGAKGDKGNMGVTGMPGPCSPVTQAGFTAALTMSYPEPLLPVIFARVITNVLGTYNPMEGVFTAPANGTYVFSYNLQVMMRPLVVGLFRNFVPQVRTTEPNDLGTASQTIVLHLQTGDRIWIQVKDNLSNGMFAGPDSSSTFSGFLLYPDSCDIPLFREFPMPVKGTYSWDGPTTPTPSPTPEP